MDSIEKSKIDFNFPFRISICGSMNQGKSTKVFEILSNIEGLCQSEALMGKIKVLLLSRNSASIQKISSICNSKNFHFERWATLQNLDRLKNHDANYENLVFILEDYGDIVATLRLSRKTR